MRTVLEASGFAVEALTRMQPDSPDCVATLDGERVGIEVTELVSGEARKRTGNWSLFRWDQPSFLTRVQEIIDTKAAKPFQGGPYARRVLVIWTNEFHLDRGAVVRFLDGQRFHARGFTDVVLGLDYHPEHPDVAYRLALEGGPASQRSR